MLRRPSSDGAVIPNWDQLWMRRRSENDGFAVFLVDDYFDDQPLGENIPSKENDMVFFVDIQTKEPTTEQVDLIRDEILKQGLPAVIIGIGGGSAMDIAKATSLMVCNEGSSELYQGLNLVKKPGVYAIGVPTISGTGAEVSMTAVLTGPEKKLGLKCEWTVLNQIILGSGSYRRCADQPMVLYRYGQLHSLYRV